MSQSPKLTHDEKFNWKLWIYTNYNCNLSCSYCVASSSPTADQRAISLSTVKQLVDEAKDSCFSCIYFTGGEPLIHSDIFSMLSYASKFLPTILLTNAMLLKGDRLKQLIEINNEQLIIQVSLDGGQAAQHDAYRGIGSWDATVVGIHTLLENGFQVRLSTTETKANTAHLDEVCAFHLSLGIPEENHFIRPLAKRGFSSEGIEVGLNNLLPEITANVEGIYWHPLATEPDMLIGNATLPLSTAVQRVQERLTELDNDQSVPLKTFT